MSRRGTLAALVLAVVWSCASAPPTQDPLAGCYQFERSAGARALGLPWGVVLEDEPLGDGWPGLSGVAGVRRARTAVSATERSDAPFGYWKPAPADSVEVGYPGGGGVVLRLGAAGQDLVGRGVAAGDAVPLGGAAGPRPPSPVVARRVLCGAA